jgi:ABC-type uncharacterized transport system involved in gliding motility auxiliary subunit
VLNKNYNGKTGDGNMNNITRIIGIAGLVLVLAAFVWYTINNIWGTFHWIFLVLGLGGIVYYVYTYYKTRDKVLSARSVKYGSNVFLQVLITLAIVSMIAYVSTRQHYRTDLTANNFWSLSDQTTKVLENLDKPVEIKAFFKTSEQSAAKDQLDEYSYRSSNLTYELIDPDEEPQITQQYGVSQYNSLVIESGIKRELVTEMSESNITNAVIKVTREQDKVVYFLTGHGERSIKDDTPQGYKKAADAIKNENHLVRELNLVRRGSVPDSCTVLAIVRPSTSFFPGELDSIKTYLDNGGKTFALLDPSCPEDVSNFFENYKVTVGNNMVIDVSGVGRLFGAGPAMPLVSQYDQNHGITKGFGVMTFFDQAASVTPMDDKGGFTITELLKTSSNSWADSDWSSGKVAFDADTDTKGPVTIGVVVEKDLAEGKTALAIFGDSDFAMNGHFGNQGNSDLFLNTVNYLAEEEDLISIRPKEVDDRRLTLTQANVSTLFYLVVITIPLLVIILGVVIFIRRNRA